MNKLITKARSGVTLVELLVVILIITILSVGLLPLLKPYIEQAKYAAEVQPTLGNIQTKINLYQYEKDQLPCTIVTTAADNTKTETQQDNSAFTWTLDTTATQGKARVYKKATIAGLTGGTKTVSDYTGTGHLSNFVDVDWQDLTGKRINPSQFQYHVIKGLGAANYGYAIGMFGDGDGIAKGTGYAILVIVDTTAKMKVVATWERYKPATDEEVVFKAVASDQPSTEDRYCRIPTATAITGKNATQWNALLELLKGSGWSFNFDDVTAAATP